MSEQLNLLNEQGEAHDFKAQAADEDIEKARERGRQASREAVGSEAELQTALNRYDDNMKMLKVMQKNGYTVPEEMKHDIEVAEYLKTRHNGAFVDSEDRLRDGSGRFASLDQINDKDESTSESEATKENDYIKMTPKQLELKLAKIDPSSEESHLIKEALWQKTSPEDFKAHVDNARLAAEEKSSGQPNGISEKDRAELSDEVNPNPPTELLKDYSQEAKSNILNDAQSAVETSKTPIFDSLDDEAKARVLASVTSPEETEENQPVADEIVENEVKPETEQSEEKMRKGLLGFVDRVNARLGIAGQKTIEFLKKHPVALPAVALGAATLSALIYNSMGEVDAEGVNSVIDLDLDLDNSEAAIPLEDSSTVTPEIAVADLSDLDGESAYAFNEVMVNQGDGFTHLIQDILADKGINDLTPKQLYQVYEANSADLIKEIPSYEMSNGDFGISGSGSYKISETLINKLVETAQQIKG